uniref:Calnexin n=1 Tax=Aceria tosichella TaxID=561515 RepID=A0A6G1S6L2_9ACAR
MLSRRKSLFLILSIGLTFIVVANRRLAVADEGPELDTDQPIKATDDQVKQEEDSAKSKSYTSPKIKLDGVFLYENFDDQQQFKTKWINSKDPKYTGEWQLNSGPDRPHADLQLLLPVKARHYAISSKLSEPFKFSDDKPLVVQYEVQFREGLDCGGAYVKLLRNSAIDDLTKLTDKTPYSIMFGPDKCGSEAKLHFIIQYYNPKTQEYGEKHWKQAKYVNNLLAAFSDKKHHLFKLVLEPSNNFEIFLDDKSVGKGNLLEDVDPPINPPKEIVDPSDTKPDDWDERPQIEDPQATKPEDWDENAPKTIEDPNAKKPSDWLDNEPKYVPDPNAKKPEDWEDMDGEWEAPLIDNPACEQVSGCGEWKPPTIANPNYKGKWKPPKIDNPNYKGKWAPRSIPNPDYFFDEKPFSSLDPIGAIAYELWSMADNIAFDNLIITNNPESAHLVQVLSWEEKKAEADASSPSQLTRAMHYLKMHPWLWAIIVIAIALPLFIFISYCCETKKSSTDESARRKKTDESKPDESEPDESKPDEHERQDDDNDDEEVAEEEEDEEEGEE